MWWILSVIFVLFSCVMIFHSMWPFLWVWCLSMIRYCWIEWTWTMLEMTHSMWFVIILCILHIRVYRVALQVSIFQYDSLVPVRTQLSVQPAHQILLLHWIINTLLLFISSGCYNEWRGYYCESMWIWVEETKSTLQFDEDFFIQSRSMHNDAL